MSPGPGQTVGRSRELEELDARLEAVAAGAPACIALEGEPGIGKTRLLQELRERAEARGQIVLAGAAAEFERDMPFGVWVEALDAYVASQDPGLREDFNDGLFNELGAVLPAARSTAEKRTQRSRMSVTARTAPSARFWKFSLGGNRSWSCSTTSTGPTPARSS